MARKKYLDEGDEHQQQENRKSIQNKKNIFSSSPPRTGALGLIHNRGRSNHKIHNQGNDLPLTAEESLFSVVTQLSKDGLTLREMPGDGNCLFRALSDQLEGNTRNHLHHRRAVVEYMKDNRSDFEPFVEDDQPFEKYLHSLSTPGTFAGNDAIVAFARLHNVTIVIHQLNSPAWLIHPTSDEHNLASGREVHIAYHNGDHYNSVRKIGDDSDTPANIRFISQEHHHHPGNSKAPKPNTLTKIKTPPPPLPQVFSPHSNCTVTAPRSHSPPQKGNLPPDFFTGRDEDYWVKDEGDIDRLVDTVIFQTDYPDPTFVRDTLIDFNFDMVSTVDFILSMSFIMTQSQCEAPPKPTQVVAEEVKLEADSLALEDGKVLLDLDTGIGISSTQNPKKEDGRNSQIIMDNNNSVSKEPSIGDINIQIQKVAVESRSSSSSESIDDEDKETASLNPNQGVEGNPESGIPNRTIINSRTQLSGRQRKELKKKERKREAERRKKVDAPNNVDPSNHNHQPQIQYSTIRSLNI